MKNEIDFSGIDFSELEINDPVYPMYRAAKRIVEKSKELIERLDTFDCSLTERYEKEKNDAKS